MEIDTKKLWCGLPLVFALMLTHGTASYSQTQTLPLPRGAAITVDGKLLDEEWKDAVRLARGKDKL